jgi:mevalonate kinase
MTKYNVLLLYDKESRKSYISKLKEMMHDANACLKQVDDIHDPISIPEKFDRLVPDADVILIDVTHPNTNIGIEVGKHFLRKDLRILIFHCRSEPFSRDKIPFYLAHHECLHLDPTLDIHEFPNEKLYQEIVRVGTQQVKYPLPRYDIGPKDDTEAMQELAKYGCILKSPAAAFFFGEYAVTVGHPALYLPLPLYIYVGIKEGEKTKVTYLQEAVPSSRTKLKRLEMETELQEKLREALDQLAPKAPPLEIAVWAQAPTMCGLATSSALSACIARYLTHKGYTPDCSSEKTDKLPSNVNLLGSKGVLNSIFRTTWKLDLSFHGLWGSGSGSFATLAGTSGPNPVLYFSAARKMWEGDRGRHGWKLGKNLSEAYAAIDEIPCWGFRLSPSGGMSAFKPSHFALVYTGQEKSTSKILDVLQSMSRYFLESPEMVKQIIEAVKTVTDADVRHEIQSRITESYINLIQEEPKNKSHREKLTQEHSNVTREALLTAYGMSSIVGINSYWSEGDYSYLALMEACQCVLEVLGVTSIPHRGKDPTNEPYSLAQHINCASDSDGNRLFGAKITGAGTGGDLFVSSKLTNKNKFERELRQALLNAKEHLKSSYEKDFGRVHYSSTWIDSYPDGYCVNGTQFVRR